MSYKKLTVDLYDEVITLTPIRSFLVHDDNVVHPQIRIPDSKVVIYQIDYYHKNTAATANAIIPYYVSDGFTNKFRANMIFPFMSFNMIHSITSPYSATQVEGLLFKYNIGKNIKLSSIEQWVRYKFLEFYHNRGMNGQIILNRLDAESNGHRIGVTSVLSRLENLLDYFISIVSSDIPSFLSRDIRCYRPRTDNPADKYDIQSCNTQTQADEYDLYKQFILEALTDQINHLVHCRLFVLEDIMLAVEPSDRLHFNAELNICMNQGYAQNVSNYVDISIIFHRNIKAYITQLIDYANTHGEDDPALIGIPIRFLVDFTNLLRDNTILKSPAADTLETTKTNWSAVCRQNGGGYNKTIPIKHIEGVKMNIDSLIKYNDIRAVNGHTTTQEILEKLYKEYKKKYLSIKKRG